jgi:hypothetical protein
VSFSVYMGCLSTAGLKSSAPPCPGSRTVAAQPSPDHPATKSPLVRAGWSPPPRADGMTCKAIVDAVLGGDATGAFGVRSAGVMFPDEALF